MRAFSRAKIPRGAEDRRRVPAARDGSSARGPRAFVLVPPPVPPRHRRLRRGRRDAAPPVPTVTRAACPPGETEVVVRYAYPGARFSPGQGEDRGPFATTRPARRTGPSPFGTSCGARSRRWRIDGGTPARRRARVALDHPASASVLAHVDARDNPGVHTDPLRRRVAPRARVPVLRDGDDRRGTRRARSASSRTPKHVLVQLERAYARTGLALNLQYPRREPSGKAADDYTNGARDAAGSQHEDWGFDRDRPRVRFRARQKLSRQCPFNGTLTTPRAARASPSRSTRCSSRSHGDASRTRTSAPAISVGSRWTSTARSSGDPGGDAERPASYSQSTTSRSSGTKPRTPPRRTNSSRCINTRLGRCHRECAHGGGPGRGARRQRHVRREPPTRSTTKRSCTTARSTSRGTAGGLAPLAPPRRSSSDRASPRSAGGRWPRRRAPDRLVAAADQRSSARGRRNRTRAASRGRRPSCREVKSDAPSSCAQ